MSKRILLVDDDTFIRELYEEVLKNEGYIVDTACDGQEGLEKLQQGGYDAVLLDVMMPKLDGLGILEALEKTPPATPNGPIIMLTNLGHEPLQKNVQSKGISGYLIKADVTPDQILEKIQKLVGE